MRLVCFHREDEPRSAARLGALLSGDRDCLDFLWPDSGITCPEQPCEWYDTASPRFRAMREFHDRTEDLGERDRMRSNGAILPRTQVKLLAPVPRPGKVLCIGLNYRDHAAESKMEVPAQPVCFSKFPSCVIGPGDSVVLPRGSEQVDYEAELAFVIGKRAKNVSRAEAVEHVLGYVNFNDVSARDFQFADGQWQRGKSCDTFAPMGEWIATRDEIPDPQKLSIRLHRNGETLQDSSTDQLIFGIAALVEFLSAAFTLEPGDVIATGTPPGVGFARKPPIYLEHGDEMTVEIEGLGTLTNPVRRADNA